MARTPVILAALAAAALVTAAVATTPAAAQEGAVPAEPGATQTEAPAEGGATADVPVFEPQEEGTVNGFGCIAGPAVDHDPYDENGVSLIPSAPVPDDPDGTVRQ